MEIERSRRAASAVNLTPLIDVVFLLIVFFMLSTSFVVSESMELSIPSDGAKQVKAGEVWVLRVQPDGKIGDQGESYNMNDLDRRVRERLADHPDQKMLVLATKGATVQQLVSVLDIIYINGARQVQIDHDVSTTTKNEVKISE